MATKQQAALQAKATRDARHTMGKRQKEKIKGVVVLPHRAGGPGDQPGEPSSRRSPRSPGFERSARQRRRARRGHQRHRIALTPKMP